MNKLLILNRLYSWCFRLKKSKKLLRNNQPRQSVIENPNLFSSDMSKLKSVKRFAWILVAVLGIIVTVMGIIIYRQIFTDNIAAAGNEKEFLYIPTGSTFDDVVGILDEKKLLINEESFRWTARQMKYDTRVKPGKYLLRPKMNNKELISMLRAGKQVPVNVTFNNIRTKEQLAARIAEQIEAKSQALINLMNDNDYLGRMGFNSANILSMFIPDTYEFYWNTSADKFLQRMKKEYDRYWTPERLEQSRKIGYTPLQVSVLASIVQMESNKEDEKPIIAGVYINRLKKDWKLEADPTLVFALGDFSISRVLSIYKEIDSPYNTYMYNGLPPGPICLPTRSSLTAVLNFIPHKYMFFCAKDDFSGYHAFASTYDQHMINARRFQKALDRRGIRS